MGQTHFLDGGNMAQHDLGLRGSPVSSVAVCLACAGLLATIYGTSFEYGTDAPQPTFVRAATRSHGVDSNPARIEPSVMAVASPPTRGSASVSSSISALATPSTTVAASPSRTAAASGSTSPAAAPSDNPLNLAAACAESPGKVVLSTLSYWDGAGAQLIKKVQVYTLAVLTGLGYVHRPFELDRIALHGDPPETIARWNAISTFPGVNTHGCKGEDGADNCTHIEVGYPHWGDVDRIVREYCGKKPARSVVLHMGAHDVFTADPSLYERPNAPDIHKVLPWLSQPHACGGAPECRSDRLYVAFHVRRGDIMEHWVNGVPTEPYDRWIPNSYYVDSANALVDALQDAQLPPPQITFFLDNVTVPTKFPYMRLDDFKAVKVPYNLSLGGDVISAFQALARADILFTAVSTFSYTAALLRKPGQGVVMFFPWDAGPRLGWYTVPRTATELQRREGMAAYLAAHRNDLLRTHPAAAAAGGSGAPAVR